MWTKDKYILQLKSITKDALDKVDKEQLDIYISGVKSILFYIGKSVLCMKYLKENGSMNLGYINIDDIEVIFSTIASNSLKKAKELFEDSVLLNKEIKSNILIMLKSLDKDELEKVSLGEIYEAFITNKQKKLLGQVYTPEYIVKYMVSLGVTEGDIVMNPCFRVIDPACGAGYFLLELYDKIKQIFEKKYSAIIIRHPNLENEFKDGIHSFILKYNLTGFDIDPFAVYMTEISLIIKGDIKENIQTNIFNKDILIEENPNLLDYLEKTVIEGPEIEKYDLVIGNPPYVGHKNIDKEYRRKLKEEYYDVYSDKSDISYCFFKKGHKLLKNNGRLIFITSRYFLEALSAKDLREFLKSKFKLDEIVDFYGRNIFKGVGITPAIVNAVKSQLCNDNILIYRSKNFNKSKEPSLSFNKVFEKYYVSQNSLNSSHWLLVREDEKRLFSKIDMQGEYFLYEICQCNQGIITGCDKAFIVDIETIEKENLEMDICKPWVKNSEVRKFRGINAKRYILYTDLIEDIDKYKSTKKHILPYKDKLNNRRECLSGTRGWYKLQWGRNVDVFNQPKILFPYKASANEFTIEYREVCSSADVYILSLKDNYKKEVSLEYLVSFLNSSLFEFYFKSIAKKLNQGMYEYYPNKLMTLKIKLGKERNLIEKKAKKIMSMYNEIGYIESIQRNKESYKNVKVLEDEIKKEMEQIDDHFFNLYELDRNQIDIIKKCIGTIST
ncbi:MAG: N-6 DNA methylase [Tissierellales bacterium]